MIYLNASIIIASFTRKAATVRVQDWLAIKIRADELGLEKRAADALHLAVAFTSGHTLATLDKVMASAAPKLEVSVMMP